MLKTDSVKRTQALILSDSYRMECLFAARHLSLPDWYLAAGFLRNAIWDCASGKTMTPLNDVDLVYFDPDDIRRETELHYQTFLKSTLPMINWEVRNQARMHLSHGHSPYKNTEHAISFWVEIPTCVGVRLEADDQLSFCAPFGLDRNWSMKVAINPNFPQPDVLSHRVTKKKWLNIWPELIIEPGS